MRNRVQEYGISIHIVVAGHRALPCRTSRRRWLGGTKSLNLSDCLVCLPRHTLLPEGDSIRGRFNMKLDCWSVGGRFVRYKPPSTPCGLGSLLLPTDSSHYTSHQQSNTSSSQDYHCLIPLRLISNPQSSYNQPPP